MNKTIYILFSLSALVFSTTALKAQDTQTKEEKSQYRMADLKRSLLWSDSYNAAGLRFMDFQNYSFAEAYLNKNNGGLVKYYQSDNSLDYGLRTESYTRVKKVTMYGSVEYNNFLGRNMTNTGFIYPEKYLVGLGDSIPAQKRREYYTLHGSVAAPVYRNLSVGLSIDYQASNDAKMKDLRSTTTMFDVKMAGSLLYANRWLSVGGSYVYEKFHEKMTFAQVSPEENMISGFYYSGLWFGIFDYYKNTPMSGTHYFNDVLKGGSAQLGLTFGNIRLFNEFAYKTRDGYWGDNLDNANTVNSGEVYEYTGKLAVSLGRSTHYLNVKTKLETDDNALRNVYEDKSSGWSIPVYIGKYRIFSRSTRNIDAEYEFVYGSPLHPTLVLKAGYSNFARNSSAAVVNPYIYTQEIHRNDFYVYVMKSFGMKNGMLDASLRLGGGKGHGDVLTESRVDMNTDVEVTQGFGQQREDLLLREYEYYTAKSIDGMAGVRYTRFLKAKKPGKSVYGDIKYDFRTANNLSYHDSGHAGFFRVAIGYGF